MGFQYVPSLFRIPKVPILSAPDGFWRGKGGDEGFYAFNAGYSWGGHVIVQSPNFCPCLQMGGSKLTPVFSDINGYIFWEGNGYVYYSKKYSWIWCDRFPGYEPLESRTWEDDGYVWEGDRFYTIGSLPDRPDAEQRMEPRGSLKGKEDESEKTLKAIWPRWVAKNGEFGVYEGKDGESGERVKGLPRFKGGGETFVRSLNKEKGRYTYGRIHYASGKWVIGEIGSAGGWHEGAEPQAGGSVNFAFCRPEGSDAEGSDIAVSFDSYIAGDETDTAYLGSVAIWR